VKDAISAVANVDDYSGSARLLAATTLRGGHAHSSKYFRQKFLFFPNQTLLTVLFFLVNTQQNYNHRVLKNHTGVDV
jgi:hypothetical protein